MSTDIEKQLIGQLVLTDESVATSIGAIVKSVTATDRLQEFKEAVKRYSDQRNVEIVDTCNSKFRSFSHCLEWQQAVKVDLAELGEKISALKETLDTSGETLLAKKVDRVELMKRQLNLEQCINACKDCIEAFHLAQMAALHILDRKFEDALRQIDVLAEKIRRIEEYSFSRQLKLWIPTQLARIQDYAKRELEVWMDTVRENSEMIGKLEDSIIRILHEEYSKSCMQNVAQGSLDLPPFDVFLLERLGDKNIFEDQDMQSSQVNFVKLLKAAHLFQLMGRTAVFSDLFVENSKLQLEQASSISRTSSSIHDGLIQSLHRMLGFLLIQRHLKALMPSLDIVDYLDSIEKFVISARRLLASHLDDPDLRISDALSLLETFGRFMHSAKLRLGISGDPLHSLSSMCFDVFHRYQDHLVLDYQEKCFAVCNEGQVELFVELLLKFIQQYFTALSIVPIEISDMFDICKQLVLEKFIDCCLLQHVIESGDLKICSLLDTLVDSIPKIESQFAFYASFLALNNNYKLPLLSRINQCRHKLEIALTKSVIKEVDDIFIRHQKLTFQPKVSQSVIGYLVKDLIEFIISAKDSNWNDLDSATSVKLLESICKYIAGKLVQLLTFEIFNDFFVASMKDEVFVMVQYVGKIDQRLSDSFAEVVQTLELLNCEELSVYLDPVARSVRFPLVDNRKLVRILSNRADTAVVQGAKNQLKAF